MSTIKHLIVALALMFSAATFAQNVGINSDGSTPNASAMLDVKSTSSGILIPRMTETEKGNISSPATGLLVYQTDGTPGFYYYNGTAWTLLGTGSGTVTSLATGTGLTGGTITSTGTIELANTTVTAGSYTRATITVDAQGRITAAGDGAAVSLTAGVSGVLPIANGGTGQTTAATAINALLPAQTGNNGKYLTTNGTDASWGALTSSQWTTTGSDIYYNTGNVGIGTTTPYTTLTVGSTDATAKITAGGPNTTLTIAAAGSDGRIYFNAGGVANGNYSTSTRLTILPEGRVGIGTTTPADLLQVGNLMFGGNSGREISSTYDYDINYKATGASSHHFYANGTERFTIDKTGNIGIGVNSPNNKLQIGSTTYSENTLAMGNGTQNFAIDVSWSTIPTFYSNNNFSFMGSGGNGNVGIGTSTPIHPLHMGSGAHVTTAGVWTNASDSRLKTNIVNTTYGLQTVMQLRPVNYNMVKGGEAQVGFLAQEVQKIVPEVVSGTEGDISKGETLGLSYGNLVPVLTKAIQEQQALIEKLQAENAAMKAKVETVEELKADLEELKSAVKKLEETAITN